MLLAFRQAAFASAADTLSFTSLSPSLPFHAAIVLLPPSLPSSPVYATMMLSFDLRCRHSSAALPRYDAFRYAPFTRFTRA